MVANADGGYVLGLDIGAASIGWALLDQNRSKPSRVVSCGVRVFDAGMDQGDFSSGKENSRSALRRQARQARRLLNRRARRQAKVLNLLIKAGLLPQGKASDTLPGLDKELLRKHSAAQPADSPDRKRLPHTLPYWLRARALETKLEPHELGRALYHLAQRRGFLSNRKAPPKKDEKPGEVKAHITELEKAMNGRTLGQYFASLDPMEERIRKRWTARKMFEDEFDRIWAAQAPHHSAILTDDFKKKFRKALFHQRPLKNQKHLIGGCEFEPGRFRAPKALLVAQQFRTLQQVTDARILSPQGERFLTADERDKLLEALERDDLTFGRAKKLLGLARGEKFNWESGGEERFLGNRTNAKLAEVFGERWWTFADAQRDQIVEDCLSIHKDEALARRGQKKWGLDNEASTRFGQIVLEDGYLSLSRRALAKLVPMLRDGLPYATAVDEAYPERKKAKKPIEFLPPPTQVYPHIRNPLVLRVLAELRKVVNAIIREHGKPAAIRVELARDLRKSAKQRQESWKRNRRNEKLRKAAAKKILDELGYQNPSRSDIEKILLAEECGWVCPYTGRSFNMKALLGQTPEFDVEHIIPFSRSLDDSFLNKTICEIRENRDVKGNRTPFEAYAGSPEKWKDILSRVKDFKGNAADEKLRRFQQETIEGIDDFTKRQLNDTRYASRQATDYLALLYGGLYELGGKRFVQASKGGITAYLRNQWQLNTILGDGGTKTRDDHRHHAVDAVAIALTEPATVKALSDTAVRAAQKGTRWWRERIEDPWQGFLDDVRQAIDSLVVSHRIARKVNGPMHKDTNYGPTDQDGKVRQRIPLKNLSAKDIEAIADERVRKAVADKLAQLGGTPDKAFADAANHPFLEARDGRRTPIHCVRLRRSLTAFAVGEGQCARWVTSESNHHAEIFETTDKKGSKKWVGRVVTRYKAMRRLARKEPIINMTPDGPGKWRFSLSSGELAELDGGDGKRKLFSIRTVSVSQNGYIRVAYAAANDARLKKDIIAAKEWQEVGLNTLARLNCRKVIVTPLGEVRYAND